MTTYLTLSNPYTSLSNGVVAPAGCVVYVERFNGNQTTFNFNVNIWLTEATYTAGLAPIDSRFYSLSTSSVTGIAPLFDYLITLPEFTGAVIS